MSTTMLSHASVLPSITCSTCNQEIQLSMLGDHVCYSDTSASSEGPTNGLYSDHNHLSVQTTDIPGDSTSSSLSPASYQSAPASASTLPTISEDEDNAGYGRDYASDSTLNHGNDPFPHHGLPDLPLNSPASDNVSLASRPLTPGSMPGQIRSPSPLSSGEGRSVGGISPESPAFPLRPERPPSLELPPQNNSLPTLPAKQAMPPPANLRLSPNPPMDQASLPPQSPRFMERVNNISPGPFARQLSKFRKPSQDKVGRPKSKKDSFSGGIMHISSPSLTYSTNTRLEGFSNQPSPQPPQLPGLSGPPISSGPAKAPPPRPPRPHDSQTLSGIDLEQMNGRTSFRPGSRDGGPDIGRASSIYPSSRSSTSSIRDRDTMEFPDYLRQKATALAQIKEAEGSEQRNNAPYNGSTSVSRSRSISPQGSADTLPPLPTIHNPHAFDTKRHTPTESTSSTGSRAGFDDRRTESSRSSPPTSHNSTLSPKKLSVEDRADRTLSTSSDYSLPRLTYQPPPRKSKNIGVDVNAAYVNDNYDAPKPTEKPLLSPGKAMVESPAPPISPLDPAQENEIRQGPFVPPPRTDSARRPPPQPQPPAAIPPRLDSAIRPHQPEAVAQPQPRSKGDCRGCGKPIFGKSIRAADGRVSGRYHRECFVCKHCYAPFPTMSFYVYKDHPYCAQHYHTLNNSLCYSCNSGIEGRYAETDYYRKFHLDCFCCQDCRKPLATEYFEVSGSFYCEADAFSAHHKLSPLNPGKAYPERRLTRLGMI